MQVHSSAQNLRFYKVADHDLEFRAEARKAISLEGYGGIPEQGPGIWPQIGIEPMTW